MDELGARAGVVRQRTLYSNMRMSASRAVPFLVALVCGCAAAQQSRPPVAGTAGELTDPARMAGDKPDSTKPNLPAAPVDSSYEIGPEDVILVWVLQEPAMTHEWVVRTDGMVSIPLIGEIKAGGLTTGQVESQIVDKLKKDEIVAEPNVTVNVTQVHSKKVYIQGDGIQHTGAMDLIVPTHVSEAIAWAGGFREFAKKSKIRIIRIGPDGKATTFKYNDNDVSHGRKLDQNILLKPGDHIYVD